MTLLCFLFHHAVFFRKGKRKSETGLEKDSPFPECLLTARLSCWPLRT